MLPTILSLLPWWLMLLLPVPVFSQAGRNLDQFNYRATVGNDYGPEDWDQVMCPDKSSCLGWPDKFESANGWELNRNHCRSCPVGSSSCGQHHQSPIDLERNRAVSGSQFENECIDVHWMAYHDSSCTFEELRKYDSFLVDRHALRIIQPIGLSQNGTYRVDCQNEGRRWGRIDFSKGFSHWWHLSHTDFHVPSEHTQEGKQYAGEMHMYHFYSKSGQEAGIDNEMAAVTFFLEAYDDAPDFDVLNRIICAWREDEEKTRRECDIDSITTEYPGCVRYQRGQGGSGSTSTQGVNRKLKARSRPLSAHDIILHNHHQKSFNASYVPLTIEMDPEEDFKDMSDFDWEAFIAEQYAKDEAKKYHRGRELLNYEHVGPWFNYFGMLAVRTEYYYRYSGSQTIPPCYGEWFENNNRKQTNHWRVMKDPIRVSHRQIAEMHRLLRERIAPLNDPVKPCQADTAAAVDNEGQVNTARPLQSTHNAHFKTFCECQDWVSKWKEDQNWCQIDNQQQRYYSHPYNFETDGF